MIISIQSKSAASIRKIMLVGLSKTEYVMAACIQHNKCVLGISKSVVGFQATGM